MDTEAVANVGSRSDTEAAANVGRQLDTEDPTKKGSPSDTEASAKLGSQLDTEDPTKVETQSGSENPVTSRSTRKRTSGSSFQTDVSPHLQNSYEEQAIFISELLYDSRNFAKEKCMVPHCKFFNSKLYKVLDAHLRRTHQLERSAYDMTYLSVAPIVYQTPEKVVAESPKSDFKTDVGGKKTKLDKRLDAIEDTGSSEFAATAEVNEIVNNKSDESMSIFTEPPGALPMEEEVLYTFHWQFQTRSSFFHIFKLKTFWNINIENYQIFKNKLSLTVTL